LRRRSSGDFGACAGAEIREPNWDRVMTRFTWFPFDVVKWRDVSDLLNEVERGICLELFVVFWGEQPIERIALSEEDWGRRLRLGRSAKRSLRTTLERLASKGLLKWRDQDGSIEIAVPFLAEDYAKRARDSDRHVGRLPASGAGTFRPAATERSGHVPRKVPGSEDGTFQTSTTERSGGQDKTHKTDKTEQDTQTHPDHPAESSPGARSKEIDAVIAHYRNLHPLARPGEKERRLISARLKDGFTVEDLIQAINGCHASPFHRGENDRNRPYQSLELIVRDAKHVQDFIEVLSTIEKPTPGIDADAVKVMTQRIGLDATLRVIRDDQNRSLSNGTP